MQGQERDFGGAVQTDWNSDRTQAGVGVESEACDGEQTANVFSGQLWQEERTDEGQADLPSMRVAGELKIHRMLRGVVGIVGFVSEQDGGFAGWNAVQRGVEIGSAAQHVVDAAEPEARAVTLDGIGLVGEDLNSDGAKRGGHAVRVGINIMVPHDRPKAVRSLQFPQKLSARFGG